MTVPGGGTTYTITYGHDANGNMTTRYNVGNSPVTEYLEYDYANRMTSFSKSGAGVPPALFAYGYAPTGERVNKTDVSAGSTEWYLYAGSDIVSDYTQAGPGNYTLTSSYIQTLSIDSKLIRIAHSQPGTPRYIYMTDALGSNVQEAREDGLVMNRTFTTAWGEPVQSVTTLADRYGYTSRENDPESGLMHYRARWYDPRTGRFGQRDPIARLNEKESAYVYGANSPTSTIDPSGENTVVSRQVANLLELTTRAYFYSDDGISYAEEKKDAVRDAVRNVWMRHTEGWTLKFTNPDSVTGETRYLWLRFKLEFEAVYSERVAHPNASTWDDVYVSSDGDSRVAGNPPPPFYDKHYVHLGTDDEFDFAHEFGHMLGLPDEWRLGRYFGQGAIDPRPQSERDIMGTTRTKIVLPSTIERLMKEVMDAARVAPSADWLGPHDFEFWNWKLSEVSPGMFF